MYTLYRAGLVFFFGFTKYCLVYTESSKYLSLIIGIDFLVSYTDTIRQSFCNGERRVIYKITMLVIYSVSAVLLVERRVIYKFLC